MRVLFLKDVKGQGKKGQILEVNEGYARNFLLPKKLAVLASQEVLQDLNREFRQTEEARLRLVQKAKRLLEQIAKQKTFTLYAPVNSKGFLFAPVREADVAKLVNKHFPQAIVREQVQLKQKITTPGEYTVDLSLGHGVTHSMTLVVLAAP